MNRLKPLPWASSAPSKADSEVPLDNAESAPERTTGSDGVGFVQFLQLCLRYSNRQCVELCADELGVAIYGRV
jgi:hypothetical protein